MSDDLANINRKPYPDNWKVKTGLPEAHHDEGALFPPLAKKDAPEITNVTLPTAPAISQVSPVPALQVELNVPKVSPSRVVANPVPVPRPFKGNSEHPITKAPQLIPLATKTPTLFTSIAAVYTQPLGRADEWLPWMRTSQWLTGQVAKKIGDADMRSNHPGLPAVVAVTKASQGSLASKSEVRAVLPAQKKLEGMRIKRADEKKERNGFDLRQAISKAIEVPPPKIIVPEFEPELIIEETKDIEPEEVVRDIEKLIDITVDKKIEEKFEEQAQGLGEDEIVPSDLIEEPVVIMPPRKEIISDIAVIEVQKNDREKDAEPRPVPIEISLESSSDVISRILKEAEEDERGQEELEMKTENSAAAASPIVHEVAAPEEIVAVSLPAVELEAAPSVDALPMPEEPLTLPGSASSEPQEKVLEAEEVSLSEIEEQPVEEVRPQEPSQEVLAKVAAGAVDTWDDMLFGLPVK